MNNTILNSYSGIKTHQFGLDSVSNNIANVNTTGYRESRPEFQTLFAPQASNSGTPTSNEINMGVTTASNAISTKSGSYKASGGEFDLAYQGKGWFVVGENKEGEMEIKEDGFSQKQANFFTRDGSFGKDSQGYLVNSRGYYLYGVNLGKIKEGVFTSSPAEDNKNLASEKLSPLQIPQNLRFQPLETTKVSTAINLNSTQNPINAYATFTQEGKLQEEKMLNTNANIFFCNQKAIDPLSNKDATITLTDTDGVEKSFTFTYGNKGKENEFQTLKELQTLIKEKTGLDFNLTLEGEETSNPYIALHLTSPSFSQNKIQTSGAFFDALGMANTKEGKNEAVEPYNPTHTYEPNDLVSYLGIIFRKTQENGSNNPISNPNGWEIADTQGVKSYQEEKAYSVGEVVKRDGSIYVMDDKNQFLKIGEEKKLEIATFNPQNQYGTDTLVKHNNKLYKRIGSLGNSNPQEDSTNWKEISLGSIKSQALEIPSYSSSTDIFDENGRKYQLISQYRLIEGDSRENNQKWEVTSFVQDIESKNKIGKETKHFISFDKENNPIAQEVKIDFKGKEITYNIQGTENKKSSNALYAPSEIALSNQDGSPEGVLERTSINENGVILLNFSNGKQEAMGRIGIVAFTNDQGLSKKGGNLFGLDYSLIGGEKELRSGKPILGWNKEGNLTMGHIKQGYLETSNVDIGNALTELILMQRGYSMNAKSFTTGDEMIKEAINLKK